MSWLSYRWRTQQSAISNANCRPWVIRISNATCTSAWREVCLLQCIIQYPTLSPMSFTDIGRSSLQQIIKWVSTCALFTKFESSCEQSQSLLTTTPITSCELLIISTGDCLVSESVYWFKTHWIWSEVKQEHALNLSISLSAGKLEIKNNNDCLSNGEWSGKSPRWKSRPWLGSCNLEGVRWPALWSPSVLEWTAMEGESPVRSRRNARRRLKSRVVWDCSSKREVDFF